MKVVIDPEGPLEELRASLLAIARHAVEVLPTSAFERQQLLKVIPRLVADDDYVRSEARRIFKLAEESGVDGDRVEVTLDRGSNSRPQ